MEQDWSRLTEEDYTARMTQDAGDLIEGDGGAFLPSWQSEKGQLNRDTHQHLWSILNTTTIMPCKASHQNLLIIQANPPFPSNTQLHVMDSYYI